MNKNVIALAVAAAMAAPLAAQAEVKISGGVQAQLVNYSGDGATEGYYMTDGGEMANADSGNYGFLKFAASEDLGNGLKAMAVVNLSTRVPDSSVNGNRDSFIGLSGNFGTVLAGRLSTPYKTSTVKWDPFLGTFAQARGSYGQSGSIAGYGLHNSYVPNALAYANKFGMAKVVAALVIDETANTGASAGKTVAQHGKSLSVNMPVGPVEVALGYVDLSRFNNAGGVGGVGDDGSALKLGVKYTAGAITASLQHETLDKGLGDQTYLLASGSYAMGANTFSLSFGQNEVNGGATNGYTALGMKHSFSKKVSATVAYRTSDDDSAADNDVAAFGAGLRMAF